jgi:hypothetical protein
MLSRILPQLFLTLLVCFTGPFRVDAQPSGAGATKTPSGPSVGDREVAELAAFGISQRPADLIRFLESGFPPGTDRTKFPEKPEEKAQLAVHAIALLARAKSSEAVDILLRIAALNPPQGVAQVVEFDTQRTLPEGRDQFRQRAFRLLQYNAGNALGIIGDPRAITVVQQLFNGERNTAAKIQYALTLACLGDSSGVDFLVQVILLENRRESAAAAKVFYFVTGQNFGFTDQTSVKSRRSRARMYRDWWKANKTGFQVNPKMVMARRLQPETPAVVEPRSTRDLLKLSSHYFDFNNALRSRDAREQLARAGNSINAELQKTALDEMEDIDVRIEALNWFYEANRADSRAFLKKLRKDENPEIVDKANALLDAIDNPTDPARPVIRDGL